MASSFGTGSKQNRHLRKMLDEGLNSDVIIIASDGEETKCHKFILAGESDVFEAMFRSTSESNELLSGTTKMDDMCSKRVNAFLSFLYLDDIQSEDEYPSVALDLFLAGHKYNLPVMEEHMKNIILKKPSKEFDVEVAMQLFFLANNLENGDAFKKKSLDVMKLNYSDLYESLVYIKLFEKEPMVARELCADLNFRQLSNKSCNGSPETSFDGWLFN